MSRAGIPTSVTEQPRTYWISGTLGAVFFVLSGLFWDGGSFWGSLFLELGGGAFIVFLLEFLLPSALGYAERVGRVALVWQNAAVESLFADFPDDDELRQLFEVIKRSRFPARPSLEDGVAETERRDNGHRLLERTFPVGPTVVRYYRRPRKLVLRTVVIASLRRGGDDPADPPTSSG